MPDSFQHALSIYASSFEGSTMHEDTAQADGEQAASVQADVSDTVTLLFMVAGCLFSRLCSG